MMGQVLSSCAPCCSDAGYEVVQSYQIANDKNPQCKEKIKTNKKNCLGRSKLDLLDLFDPKSTEEEVADKNVYEAKHFHRQLPLRLTLDQRNPRCPRHFFCFFFVL